MPDTFAPVTTRAAVLEVSGTWLPNARLTLPLAERVRAALMRASDSAVPWQITGKDEQGRPRLDHAHAYFLPFSSRADGLLDRVLVWADGGLLESTRRALYRLGASAWIHFVGRPALRLELLDFGGEFGLTGLLGPARTWTSATPFVPPRFTKLRRGALLDTPEDQLARLCHDVLGRALVEIRPSVSPGEDWSRFVQCRMKDREAPRRWASGWRLSFHEPVAGPIALGLGSHFGLGRFVAESKS